MSDILPHSGVDAAAASRYADPIQVNPAEEDKSSAMVSRAVVMIVESRAARKTAMARANIITAILVLPRSSKGFLGLAVSNLAGAESGRVVRTEITVEEELMS